MKTTILAVSFAALLLTAVAPTADAVEGSSLEVKETACPEGPEFHYVTRDPQLCLIILYFCDPGQEPFFDPQCGCGCKDITVKTADVSTMTAAPIDPPIDGFQVLNEPGP